MSDQVLSHEQQDLLIENELWNIFTDDQLERARSLTYDESEFEESLERFLENKELIALLPRLKKNVLNVMRHDEIRLEQAEAVLESLQAWQEDNRN